MKAIVDKKICIGCGLCLSHCPDVFELDGNNKSNVIVDVIPLQFETCAIYARDDCPVSAITLII